MHRIELTKHLSTFSGFSTKNVFIDSIRWVLLNISLKKKNKAAVIYSVPHEIYQSTRSLCIGIPEIPVEFFTEKQIQQAMSPSEKNFKWNLMNTDTPALNAFNIKRCELRRLPFWRNHTHTRVGEVWLPSANCFWNVLERKLLQHSLGCPSHHEPPCVPPTYTPWEWKISGWLRWVPEEYSSPHSIYFTIVTPWCVLVALEPLARCFFADFLRDSSFINFNEAREIHWLSKKRTEVNRKKSFISFENNKKKKKRKSTK